MEKSDLDDESLSRSMQGKGVYQFVDKYGANVDGYRYSILLLLLHVLL